MLKRIIDIILSLVAIILLTPFLLPVIVVLKMTGEHYILYFQERIGQGGKLFNLLKFATMLKDSPNMGSGDITLGNDPRVLPFGRFLRKTKINELPQLFNILKGDISFVGPRPLTTRVFSLYPQNVKEAIKDLKPGLTGVGSIVFRDEESIIFQSKKNYIDCYREDISPYKGELEIWYKKNQNIFLDLKLIFLTAWIVVNPSSKLYKKILKNLPEHPLF